VCDLILISGAELLNHAFDICTGMDMLMDFAIYYSCRKCFNMLVLAICTSVIGMLKIMSHPTFNVVQTQRQLLDSRNSALFVSFFSLYGMEDILVNMTEVLMG
jgi:hypothetical protein